MPKQPGREKNSYAKRKTDQLNDSADETIPQLPTKTNFISLLPSCEKLGLTASQTVSERARTMAATIY